MALIQRQYELFLGGRWVDITPDVYTRDGMTIARGRSGEGASVDPGQLTATIQNRDGTYSPRNPLSPYYGQLGRGTPLRASVVAGPQRLLLDGTPSGYASAPAVTIPADLDVRVEADLPWQGEQEVGLIGQWSNTARTWLLTITRGQLGFYWQRADGGHGWWTPIPLPPLPYRAAVRLTMQVSTGTITIYTAAAITGPWTQVAQTVAGVTTLAAGAPLVVGPTDTSPLPGSGTVLAAPVAGGVYAAQVLAGIGGTLVAAADFGAQVAGTTNFTDAAGLAWSLAGSAAITARRTRMVGELVSLPPTWDRSGQDAWVPVQAAGILRRLSQGQPALQSTLRRRVPSAGPIAYWPMEDASGAVSLASALPGGQPMQVTGMQLASDGSLPGSDALPTISVPSTLSATVPHASVDGWQVEFVYKLAALPAAQDALIQVAVTGAAMAQVVVLISTSGVTVQCLDGTGAVIATNTEALPGALADFVGGWQHVRVCTAPGPSGSCYVIIMWLSADGSTWWWVSTNPASTQGRVSRVSGAWTDSNLSLSLGHLAVFPLAGVWNSTLPLPGTSVYNGTVNGYAGELAVPRMQRLEAEEGLPLVIRQPPTASQPVGPQTLDTALTLLQAAADVDGGILCEDVESVSLAYRAGATLLNQAPVVFRYGDLVAPLSPTDDDQLLINDATVSRPDGTSARAVQSSGPLAEATVGAYSTSVTLNTASDSQLPDQAAWMVHVGTWDGLRVPAVTVSLDAHPELIEQVCQVQIGDRIQITDGPVWLGPGPLDLIVQGIQDAHPTDHSWQVTFVCAPGGPWTVAVLDDPVLGRADTDGSTLAAALGPTDTVISVATTDPTTPTWTVDHSQSPWDLMVGGERMTVQAVGQQLAANPMMDGSAASWSVSGGTGTWTQAVVHPAAKPSQGSLLVTPDGVSASGGVSAMTRTPVGSITPGASYVAMAWVYSAAGWSDIRTACDWYDATNTFLSSGGLGAATPVPAGWSFVSQAITAPASASRAAVRVRHGGTPPTTATYAVWGLRLVPTASVTASSPQQMTVARSVNGISKPQLAGADVRLADPMILALQ